MSDEPNDPLASEDDIEFSVDDENSGTGKDDEANLEDDWAAAVAEQRAAEAANGSAQEVTFTEAERSESAQSIFPALTDTGNASRHGGELDMLLDIPVKLTVELGRTKIPIRNILQLAQGSVIELDELAGEPMDVLVNGCLIAQGEVVVVNEKFGVRLTDIITPSERLKRLR
ncbi:MAG: flagellar motor switch protein FliN [Burkholderiaceae bacterium]